jgi:hypothetical protein
MEDERDPQLSLDFAFTSRLLLLLLLLLIIEEDDDDDAADLADVRKA